MAKPLAVALALISLIGSSACAPQAAIGRRPPLADLAGLEVGRSSASDIERALGKPRGFGFARLRGDLPRCRIWFYERVDASRGEIRMMILLVFLHDEKYDGHLWFDSSQELEMEWHSL